jgi:hypothetical protein
VQSVSFVPVMIGRQYRPEVLRAGGPRFDDVLRYMDWHRRGSIIGSSRVARKSW